MFFIDPGSNGNLAQSMLGGNSNPTMNSLISNHFKTGMKHLDSGGGSSYHNAFAAHHLINSGSSSAAQHMHMSPGQAAPIGHHLQPNIQKANLIASLHGNTSMYGSTRNTDFLKMPYMRSSQYSSPKSFNNSLDANELQSILHWNSSSTGFNQTCDPPSSSSILNQMFPSHHDLLSAGDYTLSDSALPSVIKQQPQTPAPSPIINVKEAMKSPAIEPTETTIRGNDDDAILKENFVNSSTTSANDAFSSIKNKPDRLDIEIPFGVNSDKNVSPNKATNSSTSQISPSTLISSNKRPRLHEQTPVLTATKTDDSYLNIANF